MASGCQRWKFHHETRIALGEFCYTMTVRFYVKRPSIQGRNGRAADWREPEVRPNVYALHRVHVPTNPSNFICLTF